ncbi:PREDICTED: phosphatidylinositol N-acetylglucosaminyltransferase subunit H-like isoform X2 [Priapulus caudatus]|uniref:Phosphatidylinositol N-acetylglucosaminyltransferase subunit H-like isoform X2 n=1 Tax=Priapulus caudatus TaxID=37621 RepID=A0ABM1EIE4_PRICU|nr:PREDICTED: phosphatidylinositol N-acetylglucosaminyltransferase subunit H-like isoform X2 [Priapulus caudatus]
MADVVMSLKKQNTERLFGALVLLVILLIIKLHLKVTKESLLVIASLGIQLTTTFASGRTTTQFVEATHVHDVIINEAVTMHRIIFYLAILQNGINYQNKTERLMPLFQNFYPRLDCLRKIYEGVQKVLFHKSKDTLVDIKFT